jgi:H+/Cl- antiporter ClcA
MMGVMRRLLALFLAHLTATVVAVVALGVRRFVYGVPLTESLTPVRFLPHLLLGPVYAIGSLVRFFHDDKLLDKRLCESYGYLVPLLVCYVVYARLLVGKRRRGPIAEGFTPVVRDRFPEENAPK